MTSLLRRRMLVNGSGWIASLWAMPRLAAAADSRTALSLEVPAPMARLHVTDGDLLGLSLQGELWQHGADRWRRIGGGLDPGVPLASGYGRIVGRGRDSGLWVVEAGRISTSVAPKLAPHAGMLVLALAVIAVARASDGLSFVVRLEPDGRGRWAETARGAEPVLPDARPVRFDPAGTTSDEDGHVIVLAGPDRTRYRHGVLGDDTEATAMLYLERHSLEIMRRLDLPDPFVFEDLAPRPVRWRGQRALLTVRSGPQGAQLIVVGKAEGMPRQLAVAAFSEPLGQARRWLAPTTDGASILAVHTPHLGGVLHRYRVDGNRLIGEVLANRVANHAIGERELDTSAWVGHSLFMPTQDRRAVRVLRFDPRTAVPMQRDVILDAPVVTLHRWARQGRPGAAALLQDGRVAWIAELP